MFYLSLLWALRFVSWMYPRATQNQPLSCCCTNMSTYLVFPRDGGIQILGAGKFGCSRAQKLGCSGTRRFGCPRTADFRAPRVGTINHIWHFEVKLREAANSQISSRCLRVYSTDNSPSIRCASQAPSKTTRAFTVPVYSLAGFGSRGKVGSSFHHAEGFQGSLGMIISKQANQTWVLLPGGWGLA